MYVIVILQRGTIPMNKKIKLLVLFLIISSFYEYIFADVKLTESNFTILLDWSYDGTKILFATSKNNNCFNLATISPDGTNETQITTDEGAEFYGGFYGDKIYYFYQTDEGIKLYRVNSDGTNKTFFSTIAQGNHYNVNSFRISSTAAKMAYVLEDYYSGRSLWVINLNDGIKTQLTNASIGYGEFDFSPDGQWIVFSSTSGYLYKIKTDNTGLTQLTTFYAYYPAWSPDGTKIAFKHHGDIWTINPDGTGLTNLTGDDWSTYDDFPRWSPDNTKILWERNDNLWIMNSDGSNKLQLTSNSIGVWLSLRWNKQDNKIAFCNGQNIYTVNSNGSGLQKITNNLNPIVNYAHLSNCSLWSGDYDKIAYSRYFTDPFEYRLTVMNKDGSNKHDLISSIYFIETILFAPHKTKILYEKSGKIYTINSDGTNETYLGEGVCPVWSPDTNYIAYFSTSYPYYLCVMNSDGSNKRPIAQADGWSGTWSSDSTKIVYVYDNNLWIADLLNSTTQQITNSSYPKAFPVFSPDNSKIAFVAKSSGGYLWEGQKEIWVMNADGTNPIKIADGIVGQPVAIKWTKNNRIYFVRNPWGELYSIKPDGSDLRKENQIFTLISNFDVSPSGDIIYGLFDIFTTQQVVGYSIKGRVVDEKGVGVGDVRIRLDGRETYTNTDGYYEFKGLNEGWYTIIPSKMNYSFTPSSYTVYLTSDTTVNFVSTYTLVSTPNEIYIPLGINDTRVKVKTPEPSGAKIVVEELPNKPVSQRGTVNPDKGEKVAIIFNPDKKPDEYVGKEFKIKVFTLTGELVEEFTKTPQTADDIWMKWLPKDIASGIYIVYVEGPGVKVHKKIAIVR
jgi:Tol biopolymer transport system component